MPPPVGVSTRSVLRVLAVSALLAGGGCAGGSGSSGRGTSRPDPGQPGPSSAAPSAAGSAPAGASQPGSAASPPTTTATSSGGGAPGGSAQTAGNPPPAHPVPPSFQVAAGAPSDAEVRREVAQMKRIQRAEGQPPSITTLFSPAPPDAAGLLPWDLEPKRGLQVSVASVFRDYGLGIACGGVLGRNQLGVAHKTAPCGTLITFRYAGRVITVPVIDRGPYIAGREWDLTGATAEALGFPGLGQIEWSVGPLRGHHLQAG